MPNLLVKRFFHAILGFDHNERSANPWRYSIENGLPGPSPLLLGRARRKPPKKNHSTLYFLLLTALVILGVMAYNYRADIKMHIMHYKPQPVKTVTIANTNLNLQEINTPELTSYDVDKILSFHYRDEVFYLALRSQDGESTHIDAFDVKNGSLFAHRSFGEDGVFTIHEKMILSVNVGSKGEVYYVRNGIHTLKDGNDIISLKGSTTATRVALLPGDQQAYLYGNDNFTLADIHDGSFDNNHPAFLHNRAKPFAGGLTLVRIAPDGTVFGGGRIKTNDFNIVASFSPGQAAANLRQLHPDGQGFHLQPGGPGGTGPLRGGH